MILESPSPPKSLTALVNAGAATIPEILIAQARRRGEHPLLVWEDRQWTYTEGLDEVCRVAGVLRDLGVPDRHRRVVSFLGNQPAAFWVWLGTLWAGGEHVALNYLHRGELLADMLRRAGAGLLVTDHSSLAFLPEPSGMGVETVLLTDRHAQVDNVIDFDRPAVAMDRHAERVPSDLACVLYTSGTTGRSKAVMVPHNEIVRGAARLVDEFGLRHDDVFHNWLPLYHLGGQLHMSMTALIAGGTIALFPTFSRSRFWQEVRQVGATVMCGFSAIVSMLLSEEESSEEVDNSLRVGIIAGIPPELHEPFEQRFRVKIGENYGGSEADPLTLAGIQSPLKPGSLGRPAPDFEMTVLDEHDNPVAPGVTGEIAVRPLAPHVMFLGYEGDQEATAHAFRNLWYHTGDLGRYDEDGWFFYEGRLKHAIRRRGENISAQELEKIVLGHPDVDECAAIGVESPLGEQDVKVAVTLKLGATLAPADLHTFCRDNMARFMVPRFIDTIPGGLPYTKLGKLDREVLVRPGPDLWDAEGANDECTRRN